MIQLLRQQGIEVVAADRRRSPSRRGRFAKGAFVVKLDQPYRNYAVDLLEPQKFPETPLRALRRRLLGVSRALRRRGQADRRREDRLGRGDSSVTEPRRARKGRRRGTGLPAPGHRAGGAARGAISAGEFDLEIAEKPFKSGGVDYPAGSWILAGAGRPAAGARGASRASWASTSRAPPRRPRSRSHQSPLPRIAVWHLWADTDAIGWIRLRARPGEDPLRVHPRRGRSAPGG